MGPNFGCKCQKSWVRPKWVKILVIKGQNLSKLVKHLVFKVKIFGLGRVKSWSLNVKVDQNWSKLIKNRTKLIKIRLIWSKIWLY